MKQFLCGLALYCGGAGTGAGVDDMLIAPLSEAVKREMGERK